MTKGIVYVCGFLFDPELKFMLAINKVYPEGYAGSSAFPLPGEQGRLEWHNGHLNGIGGRALPDESITAAMVRKMKQEAGVDTTEEQWQPYSDCKFDGGVVIFLRAKALDAAQLQQARTMTDEEVTCVSVAGLHNYNLLPDARWRALMALDASIMYASVIDIGAPEGSFAEEMQLLSRHLYGETTVDNRLGVDADVHVMGRQILDRNRETMAAVKAMENIQQNTAESAAKNVAEKPAEIARDIHHNVE